jgi:3-oxoacyl-[acyl-carrier protein] reductase
MGILEGKVALVTGAGTGIGRGTALLFAAEGAKVLIAARREEPLREVSAQAPDNISYLQMDLTSRSDRHRALETAIERYGKLDILINNAANQSHGAFLSMSEDDLANIIGTNLISTMQMIQRAVPLLQKTKGNIISISSTAGRYAGMPSLMMSAYSTSRGGMNHMTRTLATELGPLGVRINAVAPGFTHGEVSDSALAKLPDETRQAIQSLCPLGRFGEPIDIARVLLFIASDQAGWVTGQILDASGGFQLGGG